ncbi:MAG: hypothetical protein KBS83_03875 [Lachnospiraceae bacterium]|nr:hypothetical protein [Candidatus Equihabitans merdae]
MPSSRSCFNKAIYKQHLRNNWWLAACLQAILLLIEPFTYFLGTRYSPDALVNPNDVSEATVHLIDFLNSAMLIFVAAIAIAATVVVFSYLNSQRSALMIHTFPVTRKSLFLSSAAAVFTLEIVPFAITAILMAGAAALRGAEAIWVGAWFLQMLAAIIFFTSLAMVTVMTTSQTWTAFVFYGIYNFMVMAISMLVCLLGEVLCFGITSDLGFVDNGLTPLVFMLSHTGLNIKVDNLSANANRTYVAFDGAGILAIYVLVAIFLMALAYGLYSRRQMEQTGDFITVPILKPIFRMCMSFFVSTAVAIFIISVSGDNANRLTRRNYLIMLLVLLIVGFLVYIVSQMLIDKSVHVFNKGFFRGWGLFTVIAILMVSGIYFDLFGMVKKIPAAEDIQSASIRDDGFALATKPEEIQLVRAAHQAILDNKNELQNNPRVEYYRQVYIEYTLKDGTEMSRSYPVDMSYVTPDLPELDAAISAAAENAEMNLKGELTENYQDLIVDRVYVQGQTRNEIRYYDAALKDPEMAEALAEDEEMAALLEEAEPIEVEWNSKSVEMSLTSSQAADLYAAVLQDAKEGNLYGEKYWAYARKKIGDSLLADDAAYEDMLPRIEIDFKSIPQYSDNGIRYMRNPILSFWYTPELANTRACLEKMGYDPAKMIEGAD